MEISRRPHDEDTDTPRDRTYTAPLVRTYTTVFNTEQCLLPQSLTERLAVPEARPVEPIASCEKVVVNMPQCPSIVRGGDRAYYAPTLNTVTVPQPSQFVSMAEYYATLFHELTHSTGHVSRLARPAVIDPQTFASHERSKEELVAEFGAAFPCGSCGIASQTLSNAAAYISYWSEQLQLVRTATEG
jgi:antirestriction protein ArdC